MKRVLLVLALALCVSAPAAHAKEGVHAHLESRLPVHAKAGTSVRVVWTLYTVKAGERRPFGAAELFVRVTSKTGARAVKAYGKGRGGRFSARIKVPKGGMKAIRFGLDGIRMYPDGRTEPAPGYFPLDNDPFAKR